MKVLDTRLIATTAVAARPDKPAMAIVHDSADVRLVMFRIEPGQEVATHTNASTVVLTVLEGSGMVTGSDGERSVSRGQLITFEPKEPHGMRATDERFVLLATISPRPGDR